MLTFVMENMGTVLPGLAVLGMVAASAVQVFRDRKRGVCSGCGGACGRPCGAEKRRG